MTSIVAEAIAGAGIERAPVEEELSRLEKRLAEAVSEVGRLTEEQFVERLPAALATGESVAAAVDAEVARLREAAERLHTLLVGAARAEEAETEGQGEGRRRAVLERRLDEAVRCLSALDGVARVAALLDEADVLSAVDAPLRLGQLLADVAHRLKAADHPYGSDEGGVAASLESSRLKLDGRVFAALREELVLQKEQLTWQLLEWWASTVKFSASDTLNEFSISILTLDDSLQQSFESLSALRAMGELSRKVAQMGDQLLTAFVEPIIERADAQFTSETGGIASGGAQLLRLRLADRAADKPSSEDLFWKLTRLFDALFVCIGHLQLEDGSDGRVGLLALLGRSAGEKLMQRVVSGCVAAAVPADAADTARFQNTLNAANLFEHRLKEIGFLPAETASFERFAEDFDTLFLNRRCEKILFSCRELIKAVPTKLLQVGCAEAESADAFTVVENTLRKAAKLSAEEMAELPLSELHGVTDVKLPAPFRFPPCKVSEEIQSLIKLLEETLDAAATAESPRSAARLFHTSRTIVELYTDLTPFVHQLRVRESASAAAVLYNDCQLLTNRLMTLGFEATPRLAAALGLSPQTAKVCFVDFIPRLRELANDSIDTHLAERRAQIDRLLKSSDLFVNLNEDEQMSQCDSAVADCTALLASLADCCKGVLTWHVLAKALANVANHLLTVLADRVVCIADMAAQDAAHASGVLARTQARVEATLRVSGDQGPRHCERATARLNEVLFCLQATLAEIDERWCERKGPLAQWLSAGEVKQLIRALFQNTDRRSRLLGRIS